MSQAGSANTGGISPALLVETLTGNSGGAVPPTANNINTLGTGSITIVGSPGTSTLTTQLTGLTNHAVLVGAGTATITKVSPSTAGFVLTDNGAAADPSFQAISASGAITTITGNSGGAESPSAGNFNILGTGSITSVGTANTETVQLTGLTNHAVLVGAGTATITKVGPSASTGQILQNNAAADPSYSTATYPSTTTINQLLYSSAANTVTGLATANDGVLITSNTGVPSWLANGTTGQILTATTGSPPSWAAAGASLTGITNSASPFETALGVGAGVSISGLDNATVGYNSMHVASTAFQNVALGSNALVAATSCNNNVALGAYAGRKMTSGSANILIGVATGDLYTGTENDNICIGNGVNGINGESDAIHIGDTGGSITKAYIAGIAGVTVASTAAVLVNTSTSQLGTIISSKRFKDKIEDLGDMSEVIYKLRPVKFVLKKNPEMGIQTGLIAEEVQKVVPRLVSIDKEGLPCSVAYHELPTLLLAEIQKLNARIKALEAR